MASHGRGGRAHLVLGSVRGGVTASQAPVRVVRTVGGRLGEKADPQTATR
jgi:hypothetical protein